MDDDETGANESDVFYIVLREFGTGHINKVTKLHATRADADGEAERLCKSTGHRFYVMKMVGFVEQATAPMVWVQVP